MQEIKSKIKFYLRRLLSSLGTTDPLSSYRHQVDRDSRAIHSLLHLGGLRHSKKPLFIDMGSNLGQGFEFFSEYFVPGAWDYVLVEPSPECVRHLKSFVANKIDQLRGCISGSSLLCAIDFSCEIKELAISDSEGESLLYGLTEDHRGETSDGASINREHNTSMYSPDPDKAIKVKTVSAGDFVNELSVDRPFVVIKMDIEGAEYVALEDMIQKSSFDKVSRIYIEWHGKYFSKDLRDKYLELEARIKERLPNGKFHDWI